MEKLNTKINFLNTKRRIYSACIAVLALICATAVSQAMNPEADELPNGPFLVKNIKKFKGF